jgi:hypothetical protein
MAAKSDPSLGGAKGRIVIDSSSRRSSGIEGICAGQFTIESQQAAIRHRLSNPKHCLSDLLDDGRKSSKISGTGMLQRSASI